jgi:hypothetical protein
MTRSMLVVGLAIGAVIVLPRWIAFETQGPNYAPPAGALNLDVTQDTIHQTICVRGWTAIIRPPVEWTTNVKRILLRKRHLPGTPATYELDHYIPLELGGAPRDLRNLWLQPWPQARLKDDAENDYNRAVCEERMTLGDAQRMIRDPRNWR